MGVKRGSAGGFSRFGQVCNGFLTRIEQQVHNHTDYNAPPKRAKLAEIAGQMQYDAIQRKYAASHNHTTTSSELLDAYDETRDNIKPIDMTGANAVDVKYQSASKSVFDEFDITLIGSGTKLSNEEKLYKINEMVLTEFQFTPFVFQKRFFRIMLNCIAQLVCGEETWNRRGQAIMKFFGWETVGSMCAATSLRRVGKTAISALLLAALCLTKQVVVAFIGYGQRASDGARNTFLKMIYKSKYADALPKKGFASETMHVRVVYDEPGVFSVISFYPQSESIRPPTHLFFVLIHHALHVGCFFIFCVVVGLVLAGTGSWKRDTAGPKPTDDLDYTRRRTDGWNRLDKTKRREIGLLCSSACHCGNFNTEFPFMKSACLWVCISGAGVARAAHGSIQHCTLQWMKKRKVRDMMSARRLRGKRTRYVPNWPDATAVSLRWRGFSTAIRDTIWTIWRRTAGTCGWWTPRRCSGFVGLRSGTIWESSRAPNSIQRRTCDGCSSTRMTLCSSTTGTRTIRTRFTL